MIVYSLQKKYIMHLSIIFYYFYFMAESHIKVVHKLQKKNINYKSKFKLSLSKCFLNNYPSTKFECRHNFNLD